MSAALRQGMIFAVGAIAGAIAGGGVVFLERDVLPSRPHAVLSRTAPPSTRAASAPVASAADCPSAATVQPSARGDGQFKLIDSIADKRAGDVSALVVIGKEAAASGRPRDAEVAFIMACRVAAQLNADPLALADAKYELGWHYANVARAAGTSDADALTQRARRLYGEALSVYTARLGSGNEKARFAASGLASLDRPAVSTTKAAPASRSSDTRVAGAAAAIPPRALPTPKRPSTHLQPSFDCSKARSYSERTICSDPQLAQLDRELGRLHSRAKAQASDPAAFKRRNDEAWHRREATCHDRGCLLAWYAQRRAELLDDIDSQQAAR